MADERVGHDVVVGAGLAGLRVSSSFVGTASPAFRYSRRCADAPNAPLGASNAPNAAFAQTCVTPGPHHVGAYAELDGLGPGGHG